MFFSMLLVLFKGGCIRKINKAIQYPYFSEIQRENFAQEQMTVQRIPSSCLSLAIR